MWNRELAFATIPLIFIWNNKNNNKNNINKHFEVLFCKRLPCRTRHDTHGMYTEYVPLPYMSNRCNSFATKHKGKLDLFAPVRYGIGSEIAEP